MTDQALKAFLNSAISKNIDLSKEFLTNLYNIEKDNQYRDKTDRGSVTKDIQKLVDQHFADSNK
jgi:hypothetical protein